jgi:tRNA1Val (adenine37-N6)-methyltransferase
VDRLDDAARRSPSATGMVGTLRMVKGRVCHRMKDQENHDITLDRLAGRWRIVQLRRGHRFSADDLLTAWTAVRAQPAARRLLDLGAGIGSIGLLALWKLPAEGDLTMVEVQAVSHALARHTVAHNGLAARVTLHLMDLRCWPGGNFDLVMASPPYLPLAKGVRPQHAQKAAARFELHGNIYDFCGAAARSLADTGVFCFSHAADDPRPAQAIATSGMTLVHRQLIYFRATLRPRIALFTCARRGARADPPPLVIRDQEGRWTAEYLSIREEMGASAAFLQRARRPYDVGTCETEAGACLDGTPAAVPSSWPHARKGPDSCGHASPDPSSGQANCQCRDRSCRQACGEGRP